MRSGASFRQRVEFRALVERCACDVLQAVRESFASSGGLIQAARRLSDCLRTGGDEALGSNSGFWSLIRFPVAATLRSWMDCLVDHLPSWDGDKRINAIFDIERDIGGKSAG